jgi:hypothetical protein
LSIGLPDHIKISLAIDFFPNLNQGLRTGNGTKPASLTSLLINFNLGHHSKPIGIMEYWNSGILGNREKEFIGL